MQKWGKTATLCKLLLYMLHKEDGEMEENFGSA